MLRATISNEQSVDIIEEVQERLHIIPNPSYPGYRFSMDSAEGLALLGTPNGKGMGGSTSQVERTNNISFRNGVVYELAIYYDS